MIAVAISLQELVDYAAIIALTIVIFWIFKKLFRRKLRGSMLRKTIRSCVQCGLLENVSPQDPKYGICSACGGVTTKGRSRKLG